MTTTKADLINEIAKESGLTRADSEKALNACLKSMEKEFVKGGKVALKGFGSFSVVNRQERKVRNPQTGQQMTVPSKRVVKFAPSKMLQEKIPS